MIRNFHGWALCLAATALVGCAAAIDRPPVPVLIEVGQPPAVTAVADTTAAIADALKVAPPAGLGAKTTIDEKAIKIVWLTFDKALDVIAVHITQPGFVRNSPSALTMKRAVDETQRWLNAASAAQRAGNAPSYVAALKNARVALLNVGLQL